MRRLVSPAADVAELERRISENCPALREEGFPAVGVRRGVTARVEAPPGDYDVEAEAEYPPR